MAASWRSRLRGLSPVLCRSRPAPPANNTPAGLHRIVPLSDTTIYEMERRGEFPRRFNVTPRCVGWDLEEVEAWVEARKQAHRCNANASRSGPDVHQRRTRLVKGEEQMAMAVSGVPTKESAWLCLLRRNSLLPVRDGDGFTADRKSGSC